MKTCSPLKVLLVTPPGSSPHKPYPATAYLAGFLRHRGVETHQADWALELSCRLFSKVGLDRIKQQVRSAHAKHRSMHWCLDLADRLIPQVGLQRLRKQTIRLQATGTWRQLLFKLRQRLLNRLGHFLSEFDCYRETVEPVVAFLQGHNRDLSASILSRQLPEGRRLRRFFESPEWSSYGDDRGRCDLDLAYHVASLYLSEIGDVIDDVDPGFQLHAYAGKVATAREFGEVLDFLDRQQAGLISQVIEEITTEGLECFRPDVLGLSVAFHGNLVGALRIAQVARRVAPEMEIVMGGGFPNCFFRDLSDPRLFDFVDYVTLDDGERPLECLLEYISGKREHSRLLRTFMRRKNKVVYCSHPDERDPPFTEAATPSYAGLPLRRYMAVRTTMHRGHAIEAQFWNSLSLAHGCYWRKCAFCDISLDYVGRYQPQQVDRLIEQIQAIVAETRHNGFHFVDEAAPPALLQALCTRLLEREVTISWYANLRFERAFTPNLAKLMKQAGCVMVMAGLEVASDRLLRLMEKGVTVAQVARVAKGFADHGIHVFAYLMYGFPSESVQETIDSLELVRQLFLEGCLHSGGWHRFMATEHNLIGMCPERFGIQLRRPPPLATDRVFTRYHIPFEDPSEVDHKALRAGLVDAVENYQFGIGLNRPVHQWFTHSVPNTTITPGTITRALQCEDHG